jgi:light-regulated signal transduction histidine kinase (bacteriophytochrome)
MHITMILGTSVLLQFVAAGYALYLIKITKKRTAWILIALAVAFMGVRRGLTLYLMLRGEKPIPAEPTAEIIALIISTLMVVGIIKIGPLFKTIAASEQKLKVANETLELTNNELENFASIASHDLQEPLRKIITLGDRLVSRIPGTDEKGRDYLDRMQNSALRMRSLVEDLLQYTRIETKIRPFEATDLNKVAQTVLEDLEARLKESEGVLNINKLPIIEADSVQMYQLFLNLIGNALKFNRKGIPPVINLDSVKMENGFWEISVEDNGIGIEEEHVDKIFKPFERLHGQSTYEGTGIGLTICNKIVSRHGGKITVKRQSSNGVTFHITLPEKQNNGEVI